MAAIRINCPLCLGFGLLGKVNQSVCTQCIGTGAITVQESDTISSVSNITDTLVNVGNAATDDILEVALIDT